MNRSAAILIDDTGSRIETILSRPLGFATNQIAELDAFLLALDPKPAVTWIKGHAGDRWNAVVDRLAVEASLRQPDFPSRSPPRLSEPAS